MKTQFKEKIAVLLREEMEKRSLELAYEVIATGSCIFQADPDLRFTYETKTIGLWFDFRPFLEQSRKEALAGL